MLLALAVAVVVVAEWPRFGAKMTGLVGGEARRRRERDKRKASWTVIRSDEEEFAQSVERDLAELPTIEEKDRR